MVYFLVVSSQGGNVSKCKFDLVIMSCNLNCNISCGRLYHCLYWVVHVVIQYGIPYIYIYCNLELDQDLQKT